VSGGQAAQPASAAETSQAQHASAVCDAGFDSGLQRFLVWAVFLITGGYTFLLPFAMTLVPLTLTLAYATIERTADASLRSE
jgi:hypothetical protein